MPVTARVVVGVSRICQVVCFSYKTLLSAVKSLKLAKKHSIPNPPHPPQSRLKFITVHALTVTFSEMKFVCFVTSKSPLAG